MKKVRLEFTKKENDKKVLRNNKVCTYYLQLCKLTYYSIIYKIPMYISTCKKKKSYNNGITYIIRLVWSS